VGFAKDLWTRAEQQPGGPVRRVRNARWGHGKRWLSVWHDEDGKERSQAFTTKDAADKHWRAMETDRERGEYLDPKAGRELVRGIGRRWLASRVVDPATQIRYESLFRLHIEPAFGRRQVKAIRPSDIQAWLAALNGKSGISTAAGAYLVLQGCLELAVADGQIKRNPAKSPVVSKPRAGLGARCSPGLMPRWEPSSTLTRDTCACCRCLWWPAGSGSPRPWRSRSMTSTSPSR
jgi:Phage integrase, N-terminal SAM-like domain